MKKYKVKEIFYTLQGEGFHSGRPAVFCRFTGCNLWSGREEDRNDAVCKFCDTDFIGTDGKNGGSYTAVELAKIIVDLFPKHSGKVFVVCTGGEPALQMDTDLVEIFHASNIEIAIETNGTKPLPLGIDWICVSPKEDSEIIIKNGNELKLVFPQKGNHPTQFENYDFDFFYIQPLDDSRKIDNTNECVAFCMQNPKWSLSLQTHKVLGIE